MGHTVKIMDNNAPLNRIIRQARQLKGAYVKAGYPAGTPVQPGTKKGSQHKPFADVSELATVAATHEYGSVSKNIPARATIGPAIDKNENKILKLKARLVEAVMAGKISVDNALDTLGEFVVSKIKREITLLREPPLSPITIKRKRSSKPLIDTAQMRNSVNFTRAKK